MLNNLGLALKYLGQATAARDRLSQAVALNERRLEPDHPALAERARLLAASVPETDGRAPPLPDVVVLLVREMELMDAMKAAGADTSGVEAELAMLIALR